MNHMQRSNEELRAQIFAIQRKRYERMQRPQTTILNNSTGTSNSVNNNNTTTTTTKSNNNTINNTPVMSAHYAATVSIFSSSGNTTREQMSVSRREATMKAIEKNVLLDQTAHVLKR